MLAAPAPPHVAAVTRACDAVFVALALAFAPHLPHLPLALGLSCLLFGLWRWCAAHRAWPLPGAPARVLLIALALGAVHVSYGTIFGRDAGVALLAVMLGLKLLEMRAVRDAVIVVLLGYFLATSNVLYGQSLPLTVYLLAVFVALTAALVALHERAARPAAARLRLAVTLLVQAAPLMLLMFVLFPRIAGPLWSLPKDAYDGMSGLDDSMTPGSISRLGQSDEPAFRVAFDGPLPRPARLYWRGPVLWDTDGQRWSAGDEGVIQLMDAAAPLEPRGAPLDYAVTLEPHNRRWLYALEMPVTQPEASLRTADFQLLAASPVRTLLRYRLTSHLEYRTAYLGERERERALRLPRGVNERAVALGAAWRAAERDARAVVQRALRHFAEEPFFYTLEPPLLGADPIDEFLFETRRGFCEHYAAAFTVLMRAAGIPTRVVTGYQGGEINPLGGYLIVRQRDAHAWAEVWLDESGWQRVDPTAAVAPERVEQGIDSALEPRRGRLLNALGEGALGAALRRLRHGWDLLNNSWNDWVIGYGAARQQTLLANFGIGTWLGKALALIAGSGAILLALVLLLWFGRRPAADPVSATYRRFCAKLARRGLGRGAAEGPVAFSARAAGARPDLARQIRAISARYVALRYGPQYSNHGLQELRRLVAQFRP